MSGAIESGTGEGYLATVTPDGSVQTEVANTVEVKKPELAVYRTVVTAGVTSATLVSARAGRQGLWVQVKGAFPCYLRFSTAAATNQDWLVAAGGEFRSDDLGYAGPVTVIAPGGNSNILALEIAP